MPPPERFDRNDLREPPRGEGGALRAFVLIALLGGAALAGGLYFGGGMGDPNADAPQEEIVGAPSLDAPSEVPLSEDGEAIDATPPQQTASLDAAQERERERERAREREREQERQRQREERERAAATPPPATTTAAATPSSGPVSLTPSQTPNQPPPSTVVPLGPSTAPISTPSRPPPSQAAVTRPAAGTVSWAQRPTARRIADLYPQRALREGIGGRVTLDCVVQASLGVSCNVASESPAGEGFGRAALTASSSYRASPTLSDGASAVGARTRLSVSFQAPQ